MIGPGHPKVLSTRNIQLYVQGQRASSEQDEDSLAGTGTHLETLYEETLEALGPDHPQSLNIGSQLADWYRSQGQFEACAKLLEALLPAQRRVNGDAHPETIRAIVRLAIAHEKLGRPEQSLEPLERALEVALELYPQGSIDLIYHYDAL